MEQMKAKKVYNHHYVGWLTFLNNKYKGGGLLEKLCELRVFPCIITLFETSDSTKLNYDRSEKCACC